MPCDRGRNPPVAPQAGADGAQGAGPDAGRAAAGPSGPDAGPDADADSGADRRPGVGPEMGADPGADPGAGSGAGGGPVASASASGARAGGGPVTWHAIRDTALERLRSGAWGSGARIPTEAALAAEFGCARATVNRALRALAEEGFLERRRRSGTRVVPHPVRKATLAIPVIRHEVEGTGRRHRHTLLARRDAARPPAEVTRAMGPGAPPRMLHLRALHTADGLPHALEDRWVNAAAVPGILGVDLESVSANEWLVGHVPYSLGRLALSAAAAPPADARHLGCAPGAAVFTLERTTWARDTPITWVRVSYPPGHRLTTEI